MPCIQLSFFLSLSYSISKFVRARWKREARYLRFNYSANNDSKRTIPKEKIKTQRRSIHSLPFEKGCIVVDHRKVWSAIVHAFPARRSSSTFVNHRGYWDKRFLSAGMNRAHIAFARVKPCRPTRFLRHRRKRGPPTFYCVDEFFSPPLFLFPSSTRPPSRVNNSSATLSKSPLLSEGGSNRNRPR